MALAELLRHAVGCALGIRRYPVGKGVRPGWEWYGLKISAPHTLPARSLVPWVTTSQGCWTLTRTAPQPHWLYQQGHPVCSSHVRLNTRRCTAAATAGLCTSPHDQYIALGPGSTRLHVQGPSAPPGARAHTPPAARFSSTQTRAQFRSKRMTSLSHVDASSEREMLLIVG